MSNFNEATYRAMNKIVDYALHIDAPGPAPLSISTTSANVAIPNRKNGTRAQVVRLISLTGFYYRFGTDNTVTATNTGPYVPVNQAVIARVPEGATHIAVLGIASSTFHITPLEDIIE